MVNCLSCGILLVGSKTLSTAKLGICICGHEETDHDHTDKHCRAPRPIATPFCGCERYRPSVTIREYKCKCGHKVIETQRFI